MKTSKKHTVSRILKMMFEFYPVLVPIALVCVIFNAIASSIPSIFMQNIIAVVEQSWQSGDWNSVSGTIIRFVGILLIFYVLSLTAGFLYNQLMAVITQGFLKKLRVKMFSVMQTLPICYFDTNNHGDIMSHYTNDIDTLRQMISQSIPQLIISGVTVTTIFCIMLYYSVYMMIVVLLGVAIMLLVTKRVGGNSARYFLAQQKTLGKAEGFIEEMMNGQKVIKVFNHEVESKSDFDKINDQLFSDARNANRYANMLMPILGNIGNVMYVVVALVGGILMISGIPNLSISGLAFNISIVVPFLILSILF